MIGQKSKIMRKLTAIGLSVAVAVSVFTIHPNMNTTVEAATTMLETDVTTASGGCTMLGVYGSFYMDADAALARINTIRYEACTAGNVPDPRNPGRMLTASDYVPIKWSSDLEQIARIRAVEGGIAYGFLGSGHSRLNQKSIWFSYHGIQSYGEVLAYNYSQADIVFGINQWYSEKDDWVNRTSGAVTGHYTQMINPSNTYVGLGDFYTSASAYPNTLAGEFSSTTAAIDQTHLPTYSNVIQKVEVSNSYISGYTISGNDTLPIGQTQELSTLATLVNPSNSRSVTLWTSNGLTYSSSNSSVASVTSNGVVTGVMEGTATIYAVQSGKTVASINISVGYTKTEAFVARLYNKCLGREPEAAGLQAWNQALLTKRNSGTEVGYGFVFSQEYQSKHTTDEEYVEMLYQVFLDRPSDAAGRQAWVNILSQGVSREHVFKGFVESAEYTNLCASYGIERGGFTPSQPRDQNVGVTGFVSRLYTKALGRNYEVDGLNAWCAQINSGANSPEYVAECFINSDEFINKHLSNEEYVKVLYRTFLGREYDQPGLNAWVNQLNQGVSRQEVLHGFSRSAEFANIMAQYGL